MEGTLSQITALVAMVAATVGLSVSAFIFFRVRDDIRAVDGISKEVAEIKKELEEGGYVSDQVVNVAYDLYEMLAVLKAHMELEITGQKIPEDFFDPLYLQINVIEKHFAELGLLSRDLERRKSAQQALSSMYGDYETLEIMRMIASGKFGVVDDTLKVAMAQLQRRLKGSEVFVRSYYWTGRPSGGAF